MGINNNGPESYGTIWVCRCCMLTHANGECCADSEHGGDGCEPLSSIGEGFHVAMGIGRDEHSESCNGESFETYESGDCDCETNTFSTSQCEGCGSCLHGERHAMTLFKN
jgi:hypothetical protein